MKPGLNNRLVIILSVAIVALLYMYFAHPNVKEVEVPVKVEVKVPVIEKEFDTIYKPKPVYIKGDTIKEIDSTYYKKYVELNDSIKKDSLFKKAIEIKTYKERVEDDTLSIDLSMKVRGDLLNYHVGYKTKPRTIQLDTVVKVPVPLKAKVFAGAGLRLPIDRFNDQLSVAPVIYGGLYLKTKKDNLISLEIDKSQISVGYAIKLKF